MLYPKDLEQEKKLDYINQIWLAIMQMNVYGLQKLLENEIDYEDIGKIKFIEKLGDTFNRHRTLGDSEFYLDLDRCRSCNCDLPVCKFVGNNSGNHFALFFELKKEEIIDIYHCTWYGDVDLLDVF